MKLNGFFYLHLGFFHSLACSYTPREIRNISRIIVFGFFNHDCITHDQAISRMGRILGGSNSRPSLVKC